MQLEVVIGYQRPHGVAHEHKVLYIEMFDHLVHGFEYEVQP